MNKSRKASNVMWTEIMFPTDLTCRRPSGNSPQPMINSNNSSPRTPHAQKLILGSTRAPIRDIISPLSRDVHSRSVQSRNLHSRSHSNDYASNGHAKYVRREREHPEIPERISRPLIPSRSSNRDHNHTNAYSGRSYDLLLNVPERPSASRHSQRISEYPRDIFTSHSRERLRLGSACKNATHTVLSHVYKSFNFHVNDHELIIIFKNQNRFARRTLGKASAKRRPPKSKTFYRHVFVYRC